MVDISEGCVSDNTYGISCHMCGKCGRTFSINGIDDSNVISNKDERHDDKSATEDLSSIIIEINFEETNNV